MLPEWDRAAGDGARGGATSSAACAVVRKLSCNYSLSPSLLE